MRHVGEEGEDGGGVVGDDVAAEMEDFLVAFVGGMIVVELDPPEESGGVLEELVIEGVLGRGGGELFDGLERGEYWRRRARVWNSSSVRRWWTGMESMWSRGDLGGSESVLAAVKRWRRWERRRRLMVWRA
ncbi:MAG TPA: hypothetical protein VGQ99_08805 [Tepidisphaeraceae bacterium]|nr:hypothetical protein [Tepidisphaeraceae bacterium]